MKRSMGLPPCPLRGDLALRDDSPFRGLGGETDRSGTNAHHRRPSSSVRALGFFAPGDSAGAGAPARTHSARSAISLSGSLPVGGILMSPVYRMARISRLLSGSPG